MRSRQALTNRHHFLFRSTKGLILGAAALFSTKRLYVAELSQQPLVDAIMLTIDAMLATVLLTLAALMVWRLTDRFIQNGKAKDSRIVYGGKSSSAKPGYDNHSVNAITGFGAKVSRIWQ